MPELLAADTEETIPADAAPLLLYPFTRLLADIRHSAGIARVRWAVLPESKWRCQLRAGPVGSNMPSWNPDHSKLGRR